MRRNTRVILVEDDADLRDSIIEYLTLAGTEVRGTGSAREFYAAMGESPFAIAVVDVGLPDQSGFVLAEYVRRNTRMGIIILTARDRVEDRVRGYDAGADIYLVKPVDCRELAAAISSLAVRVESPALEPAAKEVPETWKLAGLTWELLAPDGSAVTLTAKEMQFLECLARSPQRTARREQLLAALGYRDDDYASRALDALVRRLRQKVRAVSPDPSPIKTIHALGYCFSPPLAVI
ncbi:MAG TPA: response regulator transcription factor [Verrucomicrobiae bacterium]|nr:response regulator transcription factor [Verrucomicrobiae bacterium]